MQDRPLLDMNIEEWNAALRPKVKGTWNLHKSLKTHDLDFFVIFGSLSAVVGQAGQANYNAANTFLEAFVRHRHGLLLAGSILNLSAVGDVGVLSERSDDLLRRMNAAGAHIHQESDLVEAFEWAINNSKPWLRDKRSSADGCMTLGLRSSVPLQSLDSKYHPWKRDRRMALYHNSSYATAESVVKSQASKGTSARLLDTMQRVHDHPEQVLSDPLTAQIFAEEIGQKVFKMLLKPEDEVDIKMSLTAIGLDSLMGIELRQWWRDVFRVEINLLQVSNASTLQGLGKLAVDLLKQKFARASPGS